MSERKTMKTFFAAMNEQIGMGGYGSKIKTTPMGAFKWNDLLQLWENVNNGMQLNSIAFQDMFMMDYNTNSGDNGSGGCNYNTAVISTVSPTIEQGSATIFTSSTQTFTNTCPIVIVSQAVDANANNLSVQISTDNGGSFSAHTLGTTIAIVALGNLTVKVAEGTASTGNARFRFLNQTVSNTPIWAINVSITPAPP